MPITSKRITVYLSPEVEKKLRVLASREARTLSQIAERAVRRELKMPARNGVRG